MSVTEIDSLYITESLLLSALSSNTEFISKSYVLVINIYGVHRHREINQSSVLDRWKQWRTDENSYHACPPESCPSEIWQAHRQQCCWSVRQIAKRYYNLNYQSHSFETLPDLMMRRLIGYWIRAKVVNPLWPYWPSDTSSPFYLPGLT